MSVTKSRTVFNIQTEFAETNGYKNEIFWDLLSAEQGEILKKKIKSLIPDQEDGGISQGKLMEIRTVLFDKIWDQRKYTNGNSLTSIFYVLVTSETTRQGALDSQRFSCHPVFRTRKCVAKNDSSKCCMIFIDETGRVYQNWSDYKNKNVLPKGMMVAPKNGYYTFDENNKVNLDVCVTPAASEIAKALEDLDTASAVAGFASAGISIAAICSIPVAAPLLSLAATVGLATGAYSALRAGSNLHDRSKHDESISLDDRQARANWLGVAGGVVGIGASQATSALTTAAANGKNITKITTLIVNGMNISSIVLSGSGVANGVLDLILKYNDDEEITSMDVMQLAASLVLFTHSVNNFKLASQIVRDTRNSTINSYRKDLSNRQRRMFDKMTKETIRIKGVEQGHIDVIRSVNEIPSKQYLNDLHKINRQLNKQEIRPSFGGDKGPVLLNNEVPVDTQVLRNSVQHSKGPDVLAQVKQPIPKSHQNQPNTRNIFNSKGANIQQKNQPAPSRILLNENTNEGNKIPINKEFSGPDPSKDSTSELKKESFKTACGKVITYAQLGMGLLMHINNKTSFKTTVVKMAHTYTEEIFKKIIQVVQFYIEHMLESIEIKIGALVPRELVLRRVEMFLSEYKNITLEFLKENELKLMTTLSCFFKSQEGMDSIEASNNGLLDAHFILNNTEAPSDSVESMMNASVQLACGAIVNLQDFGSEFFKHIFNLNSFKDIIMSMAENCPQNIFIFILKTTQIFMSTIMPRIQRELLIPIATEDILYKILIYTKDGVSLNDSSKLLENLTTHFLSLNPNYIGNRTKCPDCHGYYSMRWA